MDPFAFVYYRWLHFARKFGLVALPGIAHLAARVDDIPEHERHLTPMHEAFYGNTGSVVHKWHHYLSIYDRYLSRYRNTPVRLLEIGVFKGGSQRMWRRYFGESAIIYGIDIDTSCAAYDGQAGHVRIGSQDDAEFLQEVLSEMGGIDVVIDDGSHVASHQLTSFNVLFPTLDSNGVYICEDTHTSYWRAYFDGGYRRRGTFIEHAKRIVDDLHADFHPKPQSVKNAFRTIKAVHFYNSVVVIEKSTVGKPIHLQVGD